MIAIKSMRLYVLCKNSKEQFSKERPRPSGIEDLVEVETDPSPKTSSTFLPDLLQLGKLRHQQEQQDELPASSNLTMLEPEKIEPTLIESSSEEFCFQVDRVESTCEESESKTKLLESKEIELKPEEFEEVGTKPKEFEIRFEEVEPKPIDGYLSASTLGQKRSMSSPDFLHQVRLELSQVWIKIGFH
jgi:hypothetical protein